MFLNALMVVMNITLIGMSGVGKSRIGKVLARKLNFDYVDIDRLIEQRNSKRLQELIDALGDEKFLQVEEDAILNVGVADRAVISPGGSVIYLEHAMNFLKSISKIVFLRAPLDEIKMRAGNFSRRGIVGLKEKGLEQLFGERLPFYKKYADITIDVKDLDAEVIASMIIERFM
jgi:shikimate kinase